jgi:amidase
MERLKVGIVGCGAISEIYHKNLTTVFNDIIEIEAVCDLIEERYKKKMQDYGIRKGYNSAPKMLAENKLDALMAPTGAPAWKTDLIDGDHFIGGSSSLAAIAGYPSITVPMGFIDQLPVGVSFFGAAWSEPLLFEIAYAYEQGTKHRRPPKYLVSD